MSAPEKNGSAPDPTGNQALTDKERETLLRVLDAALQPDGDDATNAERIVSVKSKLTLIEESREALRRAGLDADAFIASLQQSTADLVRRYEECEVAENNLLQATADLGDAEREMFYALDDVVQSAREEQPFDPQVQEWVEMLEEWRTQFPPREQA